MANIVGVQLLAEVEDLLRTMPAATSFGSNAPQDNFAWLGRASAVIGQWNESKAIIQFKGYVDQLNSRSAIAVETGIPLVITMLHEARHDLRMKTIGPMTASLAAGAVFDYFDEIRKIISTAKMDLLFVDPYLDADFVSRYLPQIASGVTIRLLARQCLPTLIPAVSLMRQQAGTRIEVKSAKGFHDRYLFVDRAACYHSGASFKDGAVKAPTTLTEITDAFQAVLKTYEDIWSDGTLHP